MSSYADRLAALREQLKAEKLDGFVVPLTDEHMSEYVGSYAQRLAWLTGFQGSAGSAVVLPEEAAIFVDGRYTLQVRQQVSPTEWSYQSVPETSTTQWLEEHAPERARIGYDPWLHTRDWVKKAKEALATRGAELVAVDKNPIDEIWKDRPEASKAHLVVQPDQYAGKSAAEKRTEIGDWLAKHHADAAVLSALDSIAWAFNIRGADVTHTPVALAYALVHADGTADLFVASEKIGPEVRQHLGNGVRLHERYAFESALSELNGKTVVVDPERAVAAIFEALETAGAKILPLRDPTILPKAIKNPAEIAGQQPARAVAVPEDASERQGGRERERRDGRPAPPPEAAPGRLPRWGGQREPRRTMMGAWNRPLRIQRVVHRVEARLRSASAGDAAPRAPATSSTTTSVFFSRLSNWVMAAARSRITPGPPEPAAPPLSVTVTATVLVPAAA